MGDDAKKDAQSVIDLLTKHGRDPSRTKSTNFPVRKDLLDNLLDAAIVTFLNEPMPVEAAPPITVFGDLHGHFDDLITWFDFIGWPPKSRCIFLGDYVDRGDFSMETVCLLIAMKVAYPNDMFLLRGNHETVACNYKYGFQKECERRCTSEGDFIYKRFNHVFSCMPLAGLVADQVLCMHGGLSPSLKSLDQLRRMRRPIDVPDYGLLCDLCWSDPEKELEKGAGYLDSSRGAGHIFGKDTCKDFCERLNIALVARAHQVPEKNGHEFTYGSPKEKLMTIFSAPGYQGQRNDGAVMFIDENCQCKLKDPVVIMKFTTFLLCALKACTFLSCAFCAASCIKVAQKAQVAAQKNPDRMVVQYLCTFKD